MDFVSGVTWRSSQRGLVVCGPGGSSLLIEHERAGHLPAFLDDASNADELSALLGGTEAVRQIVDDLVAERILADPAAQPPKLHSESEKRVVFTRSGVEFTGIDRVARVAHRIVMPVLESWLSRAAIGLVLVAGSVALIVGRPEGPQVSAHPWVDATVGMLFGFGLAAMHELAHAVALVHYGRTPRRAGCGFYTDCS